MLWVMSLKEQNRLHVAIDGPAGAGKSTVAREVARRLNLRYLDTGAMYRAVTLKFLRENTALDDDMAVSELLQRTSVESRPGEQVYLDGENVTNLIRGNDVNGHVSPVSAIPAVRRKLVALQRQAAEENPAMIMEGRDTTTQVLPDADYKFYLDADLAERSRRRRVEMAEKGLQLEEKTVTASLEGRDRLDSGRKDSPLIKAPQAIVIDTTNLSFEEVVQKIVSNIGENKAPERKR